MNPPYSLINSIYNFLLSASLRNLRGQKNQHKTMLIHVSKYIFVNQRIFKQVSNVLDQCRSTLNNPGDPSYKILIGDLKIFDDYKKTKMIKISFDEIFMKKTV